MIKPIPEKCPLCSKKLRFLSNGKGVCNKCEAEWIFDPYTGIIKFVNFLEKKRKIRFKNEFRW